jgi:hypothetical protein
MTASIEPTEPPGVAAWKGLALLRLMAEAAGREGPDWVNRRVEHLEFLDERAVRWRVSVDFEVPESPPITIGGQKFGLVPLTSWEKDNLVAFDLRDETEKAIWLPTSAETDPLLLSALIDWAGQILNSAPPDKKVDTCKLKETLKAIVSEGPSPEKRESKPKAEAEAEQDKDDLFAAVAEHMIAKYGKSVAGRYLSKAPEKLMDEKSFWSQVNELWRNFLIIVAVPDNPGTRRVFKMTFESKVEFRRQAKWYLRFAQSMGWRPWRLELLIGGRGGSHHLEVAAPPGVDIIRIRARPRTAVPDPAKYVTAYGGSPHVHVRIPADERLRYLATIRVRVSRPGWLTMCWLAGLAIAGALLAGAVQLSVLFTSAPEAGTAATLLLALLAVFATTLVGPGAHPLASRLLWAARFLIAVDSGVLLWAVGLLLLHNPNEHPHHDPTRQWWGIFATSAFCFVMLTITRLLPAGPPRPGGAWNRVKEARVRAWDRLRKKKKKKEPGELDPPDLASLAIPSADGYHYGDDPKHQWDEDKQDELVRALRRAETACRRRAKGRPRRDPRRSRRRDRTAR